MKKLVSLFFIVLFIGQVSATEIYPGEKDTLTSRIFSTANPYNNYDLKLRNLPDFLTFKTLEVYSIYSFYTYKFYVEYEINVDENAPLGDTIFFMDFEFSINGENRRYDTVEVNISIISEQIKAGFVADIKKGPNPLNIQFTNTSTGKYTDLLWDFGDGETSTQGKLTLFFQEF